jgi:hypothetical protein
MPLPPPLLPIAAGSRCHSHRLPDSTAASERHRVAAFLLPCHRPTSLVRSCPLLLARRHPNVPLVLAGSTLLLLAATGPPASVPPHRRVSGLHAVTAPRARPARACHVTGHGTHSQWTGPPGRGPRGCLATMCGTPPRPWAVAPGRIRPDTVCRFKNLFSNLFNPRNGSKLLEFIENCRNVQKLQTKFPWNSLEQLYTVGLIKLIFVQ